MAGRSGVSRTAARSWCRLSARRLPCAIRIESRDALGRFFRRLAQILLIDHAARTDEKRHDAAAAVLRWIGNESNALGHPAVQHIICRAARGMRSLRLQYPVEIAVKRSRFSALLGRVIALARRFGNEAARGTL